MYVTPRNEGEDVSLSGCSTDFFFYGLLDFTALFVANENGDIFSF